MSLLLTHSQRSGMVRNGLAGYYDFEKRNLIRFSQQLDNPACGASQATITADAPSPLAPNGSASADKVEGRPIRTRCGYGWMSPSKLS